MTLEEDKVARRTVVEILTNEHRNRVGKRVSAAMALAAKEASFAVYKEHLERENSGDPGWGPNYSHDENQIKFLKRDLELATASEKVTALAMEYVLKFFLDQLDAAVVK